MKGRRKLYGVPAFLCLLYDISDSANKNIIVIDDG